MFARSLWWRPRRVPHRALALVARVLYPVVRCYMAACRWTRLPLAAYMRRVMLPLTPAARRAVIYGHLDPEYAKSYTRGEACAAFERVGFTGIRPRQPPGLSGVI